MNPDNSSREPEEHSRHDTDEKLNEALETTLGNIHESIGRMEEIARRLEAGDTDLDESIRLLSEANELATSSSKILDQAVQDVVYGSTEEGDEDSEPVREEREDDEDS